MPGGSEGQRGRFVLAMAAYGASEAEIAAALDVPTLTEVDRCHMHLGLGAAQARLIDSLWKRAEAGNAGAMIWLYRRIEQTDRYREREILQRSPQA